MLQIENDDVTSAVITLNGVEIFSPSDSQQHTSAPRVPVVLAGQNRLDVTVRGRPGGSLILRISQLVESDAARVIGPMGGTITVSDPDSRLSGLSITFPPGSVDGPTIVWINHTDHTLEADAAREDVVQLPGFSVRSTAALSAPATISYPVPDLDSDGFLDGTTLPLASLRFQRQPDGAVDYERAPSRYDANAATLVARTTAFSVWIPVANRWRAGTVYYAIESLPATFGATPPAMDVRAAFSLWEAALDGHLRFVELPVEDSRVDIVVRAVDLCVEHGSTSVACHASAYTTNPWRLDRRRTISLNTSYPSEDFPRLWVTQYSPWPPLVTSATFTPMLRVVAHEISHVLGISYDEEDDYPCVSRTDADPDISGTDCFPGEQPWTQLSAEDVARIRTHYSISESLDVLWDQSPVHLTPPFGSGGLVSLADGFRHADDWHASPGQRVRRVTWWMQLLESEAISDFAIDFYADAGGVPGARRYSARIPAGSVTLTNLGEVFSSVPLRAYVYRIEATLPTNYLSSSGTNWLSIGTFGNASGFLRGDSSFSHHLNTLANAPTPDGPWETSRAISDMAFKLEGVP
jgi:hypothetical protein